MQQFQRHYYPLMLSLGVFILWLSSCRPLDKDPYFPYEYKPTIYVTSNNEILYAIDPETQKYKWKFKLDGEAVSTPIVIGDEVWIGTLKGTMHKIRKHDGVDAGQKSMEPIVGTPLYYKNQFLYITHGKEIVAYDMSKVPEEILWTASTNGNIVSSPTIHTIDGLTGEFVFVSSTDNTVRAYHYFTGALLWTYTPNLPGSFVSSPCVNNDSFLYVGNDNGHIYALYTYNGTTKWTHQTHEQVQSSPIQVGGNVLVGSNDRRLYSVDSATGLLRWIVNTEERVVSTPAFYNQFVYFGSHDNNLYCVDIIDGSIRWKLKTAGIIKSSPLIHQGRVYFTSYDRQLYCVDAETGTVIWFHGIHGQSESSPIYDDKNGMIVPPISGAYPY